MTAPTASREDTQPDCRQNRTLRSLIVLCLMLATHPIYYR